MNVEYRREPTDEYTAQNGTQLVSYLESPSIVRLDLYVVPADGQRHAYTVAMIQQQAGLFASATVMDGIATADSPERHRLEMASVIETLRKVKGPLFCALATTPVTSNMSATAASKTLGRLALHVARPLSTKSDAAQFVKLLQLS